MRKFILMLTIVLSFSTVFAFGIDAGIKGGLNMANLHGDDADDAEMKMGFVGGAFVSLEINSFFAIQPELLYSMRGAKDSKMDINLNLDYITLPVLFKALLPVPFVSPSIYAGPYFEKNLSAEMEFKGKTSDSSDSTSSFGAGLVFGADAQIPFIIGNFLVDLRYTYGLTKIGKDSDMLKATDTKVSDFSVMFGYQIGF